MADNAFRHCALAAWVVVAAANARPVPAQNPAIDQPTTNVVSSDSKPKPFVRVTISKETTYITEPLRDDGYPDYLRYLNEKMSAGVTPQNNAIIPLAKALGFSELKGETRTEYFKLLGIEPLPEKGNYFEPWSAYAARIPEAEQPPVPKGDKRTQKEYFEQLAEIGASRPWTREEFPHLANWLQANQKHLDKIVAASHLPHGYSPIVYDSDSSYPHTLICVLLPTANPIRDAAQALQCRAMYRTASSQTGPAINDLFACRRLARLLLSCPLLVNYLVAGNIEVDTSNSFLQLVASRELSREDLEDLRRQSTALPPLPRIADYFLGERLSHLDAACFIARNGLHTLSKIVSAILEMSANGEAKPRTETKWHPTAGEITSMLVRWDEPLRDANQWHDRLARIAQLEDRNGQEAEVVQFDKDLRTLHDQSREIPTRTGFWFNPRRMPTQITSRILTGIMLPGLSAAINSDKRFQTHRAMFEIGLALAEYRIDHKAYPEKLEELIPNYLPNVAVDAFGHRPLIYRKTDDGYLMYSMGNDGKDDGGKTYEGDEDADDVSIRVSSSQR
jgi:hypothetical protein